MPTIIVVLLTATAVLVAFLAFGAESLAQQTAGRLVLLAGLVVLPIAVAGTGVTTGAIHSSKPEFCLDCHEMGPWGKSLFVDNPRSLVAMHYQKRLISRDQVCFACHTNYAMFGTMQAKLNGLRHVYYHYIGGVPETIELAQPYPNSVCLHCHEDARAYIEHPAHQDVRRELSENTTSCLSCHDIAHDMAGVEAGNFWSAP